MKTFRYLVMTCIVASIVVSCQKEAKESNQEKETLQANKPTPPATCNSNAYVITLESKTFSSGSWTWIWSVRNPNPGNGNNGTSQDLSHWGMRFGTCLDFSDITGAAYSFNGNNWTYFTPEYKVDPSQRCMTTPVLKFDAGTTGTAKTYYKLVLSKNYAIDFAASGYYKSGARMPCCTVTFSGVGCPVQQGWCAYSQGYWFARPETVWCQNVTFGANSYTQQQGQALFPTGSSAARQAFTQASALQLSKYCVNNGDPIPASIITAYNTCVNFLAGLTYNDLLNGSYPPASYQTIMEAAGAIGNWIQANHCDDGSGGGGAE